MRVNVKAFVCLIVHCVGGSRAEVQGWSAGCIGGGGWREEDEQGSIAASVIWKRFGGGLCCGPVIR